MSRATKPVHGHFLLSIGSHSQSASSTPAPSKHSQSASSTPAPSKQEEPTAARKAPTDAKHRNSGRSDGSVCLTIFSLPLYTDVASLSTHLRGLGERVKAQQRTMRQTIQSLKEFAQWQASRTLATPPPKKNPRRACARRRIRCRCCSTGKIPEPTSLCSRQVRSLIRPKVCWDESEPTHQYTHIH